MFLKEIKVPRSFVNETFGFTLDILFWVDIKLSSSEYGIVQEKEKCGYFTD